MKKVYLFIIHILVIKHQVFANMLKKLADNEREKNKERPIEPLLFFCKIYKNIVEFL
jgi:hypothetical protein